FADETSPCNPTACASIGGNCEAWGCTVHACETSSCQNRAFVCPPGEACNIECTGASCDGASCSGTTCRFDCTSASCTHTTCTATSCELYCSGDEGCKGSTGCP